MKSIRELRNDFQKALINIYSKEETDQLFFIFLEEVADINQAEFFTNPELKIPVEKINKIIRRLKNHEPWQYIAGKTDFFGLKLKVNPQVLIPRPETEELIHIVTNKFKEKPPRKILDIGAGSGAMALALKKHFPQSEVWALDFKEEILEIIRFNARENHLDIQTKRVDILKENFDASDYDLIVSNPPYVMPSEKKLMKSNVLNYEPHVALFVPQDNPIVFYKKIIDLFLTTAPPSSLYFELNPQTATMVEDYAEKKHLKTNLIFDLSNKPRFIEIKRT